MIGVNLPRIRSSCWYLVRVCLLAVLQLTRHDIVRYDTIRYVWIPDLYNVNCWLW